MIVIVYGYDGSGSGHWQRWLEGELHRRQVRVDFPELPEPRAPRREIWVAALGDALGRAEGEPVTFVCHSLGCWAVDHLLAERGAHGVHAALLVAPPSPYLLFEPVETFLPPPRERAAWAPIAPRSLLVGSDDDEFTSREEFEGIAGTLGMSCRIIPGSGHINTATGYGPWPFVIEWLESVGAYAATGARG
jgi:predicted alpha/beta hydrolase family esterase